LNEVTPEELSEKIRFWYLTSADEIEPAYQIYRTYKIECGGCHKSFGSACKGLHGLKKVKEYFQRAVGHMQLPVLDEEVLNKELKQLDHYRPGSIVEAQTIYDILRIMCYDCPHWAFVLKQESVQLL